MLRFSTFSDVKLYEERKTMLAHKQKQGKQ